VFTALTDRRRSLSTGDRSAYFTAVNRSIGFTSLFNASGHPAASLPLHWSAQALPVGLQIIAQFGDEATIFRLTAQIETTRPWKDRRPPWMA
jgi:amidase